MLCFMWSMADAVELLATYGAGRGKVRVLDCSPPLTMKRSVACKFIDLNYGHRHFPRPLPHPRVSLRQPLQSACLPRPHNTQVDPCITGAADV
ncbi:hypothetical protein EmuJ_000365900 [Echinococcus multilocularis]|uniref:Uncharacterized protein n=1 Tax=Echinococcus multilocularis TaxID=6211 RepID=A0A068Y0D2_ECHMU|nr:hypothetical protein EmuJ_000365900 [Echinococcus multilocularis]